MSSASGSSTPSGLTASSDSCSVTESEASVRKRHDEGLAALSRAWQVPICPFRFESLPDLKTLTLIQLLKIHASWLRDHHTLQHRGVSRRIRGKQSPSHDRLLNFMLQHPGDFHGNRRPDWKEMRSAGGYVTSVLSRHYMLPNRSARDVVAPLWLNGAVEVKANFWWLKMVFGNLENCRQNLGDQERELESSGFMFTWQTLLGRPQQTDCVSQLLAVKAGVDDITSVAQADEVMQLHFDECAAWFEQKCLAAGFECWGIAMELNSQESDTAKVHLHAYACRHWKFFNTNDWAKRSLLKSDWAWQSFVPNVQEAKVRPNANPMKVLTTGLYYVLAPKYGSVFRQSNMTLWKEYFVLWSGLSGGMLQLPGTVDCRCWRI